MNHTVVLRTPLDGAGLRCSGLEPAPMARGLFVTARPRAALESPVLRAPAPFDDLVGSWNAELPAGARLEMQARVLAGGRWSAWYSLGSALGRGGGRLELRSPEAQEDAVGSVAADTLRLKLPARAFRLRIGIDSARPALLRLASVCVSDGAAPPRPAPFRAGAWVRELPVRGRSQMVEAAAIRRDICSPTSLAAVLEHWGVRLDTAEMARRVRDSATGAFGNWTFNAAAAGALGLEACVCRLDSLEELAAEIARGRPVVVSLTFGPGELDGAPLRASRGHLLVAAGFTPRGDVIVMDPAAPSARSTRRIYERGQFHRAWRVNKRGLCYLVEPFRGRRLTVAVPAADLWSAPRPRAERLSQLLYGESVAVLQARGGWTRVEAEEQRHLVRGRWRGYPGWLRAGALTANRRPEPNAVVRAPSVALARAARPLRLSLGTRLAARLARGGWLVRLLDGSCALAPARALAPLRPLPEALLRRRILRTAGLLLGRTYHWGGRSGVQPRPQTGVDCSGLAGLAYRACGLELARDAHQQMLLARPVPRCGLKPADLVFLSAGPRSRRVTHIMLYAGRERLIESRRSAGRVLRCTFRERFGLPLARIEPGSIVTDLTFRKPRRRRVFFGSYF
ncbi:MAG: C39 family peptidase [Elusimicrobia bacterium]|nr:C39 family peptidase [Elusimicrobiota bacterium]